MSSEERLDRIEAQIEKQNSGIRDLIVVSRTVLNSIEELREVHREDHKQAMAEIDKLREAQAATDEKLNILIDTVDKIIRRDRPNGQEDEFAALWYEIHPMISFLSTSDHSRT